MTRERYDATVGTESLAPIVNVLERLKRAHRGEVLRVEVRTHGFRSHPCELEARRCARDETLTGVWCRIDDVCSDGSPDDSRPAQNLRDSDIPRAEVEKVLSAPEVVSAPRRGTRGRRLQTGSSGSTPWRHSSVTGRSAHLPLIRARGRKQRKTFRTQRRNAEVDRASASFWGRR